MTKVTIDRALIEQAIEALKKSVLFCNHMGVGDWQPTAMACHSGIAALRAALAVPEVEPSTDDSSVLSACQKLAQAFKTSPPPPAEQAVEPVSLTTEEYTALAHRIASKYAHRSDPRHIAYTFLPHTLEQFVREIEQAVRRKAGL